MKKTLIFLVGFMMLASSAFAVVTTLSYVSPEDVSITRLESNRQTLTDAANAVDGTLITLSSVSVGALTDNARTDIRWDEGFSDWVYTGLVVPTTSATLTATTTSGTAYVTGTRVEKDATAHLYTASKWTFVDLSSAGVYTYVEEAIGASDPSITSDSVRLSRVSSDGTEINAIRDDRVTAVTLGSEQENYQRENFTITVVTPDAVTLSPGIAFHGTTRIIKEADTVFDLGTAGDWATSGGTRGNSDKGYVVVNSAGTQYKLSTTDPTMTDTSGNSAGELRYSVIDSAYWRVLDWFWMNATGSGNLTEQDYGSWRDNALAGEKIQQVYFEDGEIATGTTALPYDDTIPTYAEGDEYMTLDIIPTNALNLLRVDVIVNATHNANVRIAVALFKDGTGTDAAKAVSMSYALGGESSNIKLTYFVLAGTVSSTTFQVRVGGETGATLSFNGVAGARYYGGSLASSITITEIKQGA